MISTRTLIFLYCYLVALNSLSLVDNSAPLTRRKRYLNFPNKAAVSLTISLLKGIANDIIAGPTVKVVTIHELDVFFPLPHEPSPFDLSQTALGQPPIFHQAHSRQRKDLFSQLEDLLYLKGFEGRSCIMKALCEAKVIPAAAEENLLQELLLVIFSLPRNATGDAEEDYKSDKSDCRHYKQLCPISIFDLVLDWAHQFSTLYIN